MKFPKGNEIYNKTPSQLINLKELVAWFRMEKFNGVLIGESGDILTEILIWEGLVPKAFTHKNNEVLAEDDTSMEIFVNDFMTRINVVSLYSHSKDIIDTILIQYFAQPKIFQEETYLFIPHKLIEECKKEDSISHIFVSFPDDNIHFLFNKGNFLGYYSEKDGSLKYDLNIINDIFNSNDGLLSFYQIQDKKLGDLFVPSLKFSFVEDEITKWLEKILNYVNFVLEYYNLHGIHIENVQELLKDLTLLQDSLVFLDNKFILKKEIVGSYNEAEGEIVKLLVKINKNLSNLWGKKLIYQKYFQAYKKFLEEYKKDPALIELLDKLNPENIDF